MTLPTEAVERFLSEHSPQFETGASGTERMGWDEIDLHVRPSVVMILRG